MTEESEIYLGNGYPCKKCRQQMFSRLCEVYCKECKEEVGL